MLVNLWPLAGGVPAAPVVEAKALLMRALRAGLINAKGRAVTVLRAGAGDLQAIGQQAALEAMHNRIAGDFWKHGVRASLITLARGCADRRALRPVLALAAPQARAVHRAALTLAEPVRAGADVDAP